MSADEMVDIVDRTDRVIGCTTRRAMRQRNLRHRCVWIFVVNSERQLFVHQRTESKDVYPGFWDVAVGGVVGAGESYAGAAVRELAEELGVQVAALAPLAPVTFEDAHTRVLGWTYACRFDGAPTLQASEVQRGEWISYDELLVVLRDRAFCPDGLAALVAICRSDPRESALAWEATSRRAVLEALRERADG